MGFGRGIVTETVYAAGILLVTALSSNLCTLLTELMSPWWQGDLERLRFICFVLLLLVGLLAMYRVLQKLAPMMLRERLNHWSVQTSGLVVGGIRGLWSAGLVLLLLLALGIPYLAQSVHERSLLAPQIVGATGQSIKNVARWLPGFQSHTSVVPMTKVSLPHLPKELQPSSTP